MYKLAISILFLVLSLAACTRRVDGRLMNPLSITVSTSQATVGEQVTVTLTGGFVNLKEAKSPDYIVPNFRLGACFRQTADFLGENKGGLCLSKDLPLPPYIVVTEGQSYQKAFGKQVIKSGEEVNLKHTFSFTSTDPGSISLSAMSQIVYDNLPGPAYENSLDVQVQFK